MLHTQRPGDRQRRRPGRAAQEAPRRKKRKELLAGFSNILALRFKGIDPERLLNWLYPKVRWFYSLPARLVCLALALSALLLVMVQFDTFHNKLPTFHQFFEAKNWVYLGVTLAITKVIHEFGHGLTCKHFGGECHEMGVMFLVLTPCLYCNVSDSWMLPNKWHRAWIGAAGMYVEIVIASICHLPLVVQRAGHAPPALPEHDVRLLGEHRHVQRQPAVALRRLLHPGRHDGDSEPAAEGQHDSQPQAGRLVPGPGRARRSVSAAAQPVVLRRLHRGRGHLSLGGPVRHHLVPLQGLRALWPEGGKPDAGLRCRFSVSWPCRSTRWASSSTFPEGSTK